jgi:hypothetical protein
MPGFPAGLDGLACLRKRCGKTSSACYLSFVSESLLTSMQFISSRGNEYFCEIDEEYLTDRFNLTGLNTEVYVYQAALDARVAH